MTTIRYATTLRESFTALRAAFEPTATLAEIGDRIAEIEARAREEYFRGLEARFPLYISKRLDQTGFPADPHLRRRFYGWLRQRGLMEEVRRERSTYPIKAPTEAAFEAEYAVIFEFEDGSREYEWSREGIERLTAEYREETRDNAETVTRIGAAVLRERGAAHSTSA